MKTILLILLIIFTSFSGLAQSIEGVYYNKWEAPSGESLAYTLHLHDDGTFVFSSDRTYLDAYPDQTLKAKGTWQMDGHLLILEADEDQSEHSEFAGDLNKSKARYLSLSPRNPKFNLVKPSFKFFESNIFFAKDMELFKTDINVTLID